MKGGKDDDSLAAAKYQKSAGKGCGVARLVFIHSSSARACAPVPPRKTSSVAGACCLGWKNLSCFLARCDLRSPHHAARGRVEHASVPLPGTLVELGAPTQCRLVGYRPPFESSEALGCGVLDRDAAADHSGRLVVVRAPKPVAGMSAGRSHERPRPHALPRYVFCLRSRFPSSGHIACRHLLRSPGPRSNPFDVCFSAAGFPASAGVGTSTAPETRDALHWA